MATRSLEEAATRAARKYWNGTDQTGFDQPPDVLNGEAILSINAAGTGVTRLIESNASDQILVGGKVAGGTHLITFNIPAGAAAGDYDGTIVVPYAWKAVSVSERHQTLGTDGSAVTLMVKKVPSGTAKASGTDMLAAGISLKATIDTVQSPALHAAAANYTGAAGDGIGLVLTGTATAVDGVTVSVEIQRV